MPQVTVTDRFFEAFDQLREIGRTSVNQFCRELGADKRNFMKQYRDHSRRILRAEWLSFLVLQHGVSADWLLTGRGWMFGPDTFTAKK